MKKELETALFDKYPSLFREREKTLMRWGITCGDGWYRLVDLLSEQIVNRSTDIQACQVKEKLGELRFYLKHTNEENCYFIYGLTSMASLLSIAICDKCGLKGNRYYDLYICTRCEKHRPRKRQKEQWLAAELPFKTNGIGAMWLNIINMFYLRIDANPHIYTDLTFVEARKVDGKLVLVLENGDDSTNAMLLMLHAYANLVDEETGEWNDA